MDLSNFTCRDVTVSFAVLGFHSLTEFSEEVSLTVHGGAIMINHRLDEPIVANLSP